MSKKAIGIAIIIILLMPILFFPIGGDQVIYFLGGKTIAEGGKIYVDFIDLKQPLIYEMMAVVVTIFGFHEISIRIFDLIWQLATVASLFFVVKRTTNDELKAFGSALIYVLLYSVLNFSQTVQCEGFASLPIVWIVYLSTLNKKFNFLRYIIIGSLIGFIIALKYTLGIVLIAFIINLFFKYKFKAAIKPFIVVSIGAIFVFLLSYYVLLDSEVLTGYIRTLNYLFHYLSYQGLNIHTVKESLKSVGKFLGDKFSFLFLVLFLVGIYKTFKIEKKDEYLYFYRFSLLIAILLFISVFIEKKYSPYHFSRIYLLVAIMGGWGIKVLIKEIREIWLKVGLYRRLLLISFIGFAFLFSPVPRWIALLPGTYYYFANENKYDDYFTRREELLFRKDYKTIRNIIQNKAKPNDKLTVVSVGTCAINFFSGLHNLSKFGQSQFYYGRGAPDYWVNEFHEEIKNSDWIVIQDNDRHPSITGTGKSSWESFQQDSIAYSFVKKHFSFIDTVSHFYILHKK